MLNKRLAFWLAVGGVSLLANFTAEVLADKVPSLGLQRFIAYSHRGGPAS